MKTDFVIIGGSSGGHILPAINLINKIKDTKKKILFITNKEGKSYLDLIKNENCSVKIISTNHIIKKLFNLIFLSLQFLIMNKKLKIIGFGGFITVIPIILSRLFNILLKKNLIFIHEQNIIYGLANQVNYKFCHFSFIAFPNLKIKSKEIHVGNFFKDNILFNHNSNNVKKKILLLGGSAGSIELNNLLIDYIRNISFEDIDNYEFKIQIPDINSDIIIDEYKKLTPNINFFNFINNINFEDFDLIISRSGSGSIFEILYYTDNVHFVPHLHSRDLHQKHNLNFFKKNLNFDNNLPSHKSINNNNKHYFNILINPYSINKIACFLLR